MPLAVRLSAPMPIVSCDVRLADADSFETVVGTFSVDGSTSAVVGEGKVELVSMENDRLGTAWADGDRAQEARFEGDPGTGPIAADDLDCLVLPTSITHAGASYELTSLGPRAFDGCDAAVVRIPASVSTVDPTAFAPLALERVEVDPASPSFASFDGALYDADLACLLSIPGGRKGAVRMPSTTEEVDPSAFSHCAGVDAISVDAGGSAYASWDGLLYDISGETLLRVPPGAVDISIHEGCDAIAADALEGCESLATVSVLGDLDAVTPAATSCGGQAGGEGPATKKRSASVSLAAEDDELLLRQFGFESFHAASQAQHTSGQASDQLPSAALSDAATYGACTVNVKGNGGYIVEIDAGFNEVGEHYASRSISDVGYWSVFIEGAMVHYGPNASGGNTYLQAKRPGYALVAWDGLDFSGQNAVLGAYSITVTAIWEPIQISLAFDPNGGRFTDGTTNVHQWSLTYAEGKKVKEIFAAVGEEGFRAVETEVLRELGAAADPMLVSCGGGVVVTPANHEVFRECGFVVYLEVTADEAAGRISDTSTRPLFQNLEAARARCAERLPLYAAVADATVNTAGKSVPAIAREVQRILEKEGILCPQRR